MSFINITTHNCIISIRVFKKQRPKMCDKLTSRGASRESHNLQFKEISPGPVVLLTESSLALKHSFCVFNLSTAVGIFFPFNYNSTVV